MNDGITTHLALAALTDVGHWRSDQEDTFLVADLATGGRHGPEPFTGTLHGPGGVALAAIDAMGAARNGAEAGHLAAEAIRAHLCAAALPEGDAACRDRLQGAMSAANRAILVAIEKRPFNRGMGCAVTLAVVRGDRLHLAQVGDTRAYVLRAGGLVQVTRDDTLMADSLARGLPPEELALLPAAVITKALGMQEAVEARVATVTLRAGDVILVCSDGLSGEVDDSAVARTLGALGDPAEACRALLKQALEAGGRDNVTILVARPLGDELRPPGPGDRLSRGDA
jgi:serine/threonine protein phosphatase PrpC